MPIHVYGFIVSVAAIFTLAFMGLLSNTQFEMMHCPEDAVIYGTGDYNDGVWEGYSCIPEDDLYEMNRQWVHDEAYSQGYTDGRNGESYGGDFR